MSLGEPRTCIAPPASSHCEDAGGARFSVAMSGGTKSSCRDKGAISEDGATATSAPSAGLGHFRAVCEMVARGGGVWEGALRRVGGSSTVWLFICLGAPNVDTS